MKTADRLVRLLVERGPQPVSALAEELGLTAAGVRRHLDALVADGSIVSRIERPRGPRGRGRPARVWAVTDDGRAAIGGHAYDVLAIEAMSFLRDHVGPDAVTAFAEQRGAELEQRYAGRCDDAGSLAEALTEDGYAATVAEVGSGTILCQHRCPVHAAATEFPELCDAETEALSRLLGTHVQRLATLAHGDGVCTLHVPRTRQSSPTTEGSLS